MSSNNAKLRLATDQDAGEALREMGYEPEHVEGTPTEQAKAMLEEARADLDEAYNRIEEDTCDHDTVGSACDELDYVINQTWPNVDGKQWKDGSDPVEHAVSCLMHCREIAIYGDQAAPSTELVREAGDSLNRAAIILWGDKFTTAFESRRDEADQRKAAATLEDETDEATDEEIVEAILEVVAKVDMDEAKSRAKADAPTTLEEAMDLLNEAADMANWLHTATDFMADGTEDAREAASIAKERAMDIMTNIMAAYYYLNGGTFADREQGTATAGNATTDGESLDGIPYVEVGYADGSSLRTTGHFGPHTVADVARLITLTTAPTEEEEV